MDPFNSFIKQMEEWSQKVSKENLEITFMVCARRLAEDHGVNTKKLIQALERLELSLMDTDGQVH